MSNSFKQEKKSKNNIKNRYPGINKLKFVTKFLFQTIPVFKMLTDDN